MDDPRMWEGKKWTRIAEHPAASWSEARATNARLRVEHPGKMVRVITFWVKPRRAYIRGFKVCVYDTNKE